MSGFEVLGIILGSVPLVIQALKSYQDLLRYTIWEDPGFAKVIKLAEELEQYDRLLKIVFSQLDKENSPIPREVQERLTKDAEDLASTLSELISKAAEIGSSKLSLRRKRARIREWEERHDIDRHLAIITASRRVLETVLSTVSVGLSNEVDAEVLGAELARPPKDAIGDSESQLIARFTSSLSSKERHFWSKLLFEKGTNFTLITSDKRALDSVSLLEHPSCLSVRDWIRSLATFRQYDGSSAGLYIFICGQSNIPGAIPLSKDVWVELMEKLEIPSFVFQLLLCGTSMFVQDEKQEGQEVREFVFRTPLSTTEDWTLTMRWDRVKHTTKILLHGLQNNERSRLITRIQDAGQESCHPMLLPVILCEMLTDSDANGIWENAVKLQKVELRTKYTGEYEEATKTANPNSEGTPETNFAEMTRMLNYAMSRFPFHEMRVKANMAIVTQIRACLDEIEGEVNQDSKGVAANEGVAVWDAERIQSVINASSRLKNRLKLLIAQQQALLLEIGRETEIARSQLQIVYNLIAQRDNKNNLGMAQVSTSIARMAKDDSFAMFTLAVMSILFLPGAWIAALFSMEMFDWSAADDGPIVKPRFWIYWAVTLPLTLVVLIAWLIWLHVHKHREGERHAGSTPSQAHLSAHPVMSGFPIEKQTYWSWNWLIPAKKVQKKHQKQGDEEQNISEPSVMGLEKGVLPGRTSKEGTRRAATVLYGPRR